ncbi:MAG: hypothetical protein JSW59_06450 [Phycisphaerales bacterium]|nr:MAG: hypothetical protein JSW59_06450 [Phycisphaerales bacterium]
MGQRINRIKNIPDEISGLGPLIAVRAVGNRQLGLETEASQEEAGRQKMKNVCYRCHSGQWADNYFVEFHKVVEDYNQIWQRTDDLLQQAYDEGLISKDNPLDETPEIMHYLI